MRRCAVTAAGVWRFFRRRPQWLWASLDALVWFLAVIVATYLWYDFDPLPEALRRAAMAALIAAVVNTAIGFGLGPYRVGHQAGSVEEIIDLTKAALATTLVLFTAAFLVRPPLAPRSVPFFAAAIALMGCLTARITLRTIRTRRRQRVPGQRKVIVFGAGEGGRLLLRAMNRDREATFQPVALLDDDPRKSRLSIEGVRVHGSREDLATVAERYGADTLAIAVPSAHADLIKTLHSLAEAASLDVLLLPPARDMIGGISTSELRKIDLADLLGRRPIELDLGAIERTIQGRRILVTGAGGSIGSEMCRQIAQFRPARLVMLDRDESALHAVQLSLSGHGLLDTDDIVLADIRDAKGIRSIFESVRPDVAFHAAALKHLPLLERYPLEAWQTNVLGTLNVLDAATEAGVGVFVNISTDKAADPACVLGYSKRVAERITARFSHNVAATYVSVRFGNVLGSRGSVVQSFTAQIERGGPVTVTDKDVERYFMLIPEACQLTLQAAAIGVDGEVMVLDMGTPVKILDVAHTLIDLSKRPGVEVIFTGLRPGEKLSEALFAAHEAPRPTAHPLVSSVDVPTIDIHRVRAAQVTTHGTALAWMREAALDEVPAGAGAPLVENAAR